MTITFLKIVVFMIICTEENMFNTALYQHETALSGITFCYVGVLYDFWARNGCSLRHIKCGFFSVA